MPRPVKGAVIVDKRRKSRPYALRFTAYGKRRFVTLGTAAEGWTEASAKEELERTQAAVRLGQWRPPTTIETVKAPAEIPTFHVFASEWWERRKGQLAKNTRHDYTWRLKDHLLPFFRSYALDAIDIAAVDRYVALRLGQGLSPRSVNMTVTLLGAILEDAQERELIHSNPARGKRRKAKERAPTRSYLEHAGQIEALLDAAGELVREAYSGRRHIARRAIVATLTFGGLRISELCALRWRDVDLATGWLHVGESKTDAGRRKVKVRGALRDALLTVSADKRSKDLDGFVFPTRNGGGQAADNVRERVVNAAAERASKNLAKRGQRPLPERTTPHPLRRTFASVLYALGEDPGVVMDEMGHTNPALALRVYRHAMRRGEDEKAALQRLVDGGVLAANGSTSENGDVEAPVRITKTSIDSGI